MDRLCKHMARNILGLRAAFRLGDIKDWLLPDTLHLEERLKAILNLFLLSYSSHFLMSLNSKVGPIHR
jgi:hypothetical protein